VTAKKPGKLVFIIVLTFFYSFITFLAFCVGILIGNKFMIYGDASTTLLCLLLGIGLVYRKSVARIVILVLSWGQIIQSTGSLGIYLIYWVTHVPDSQQKYQLQALICAIELCLAVVTLLFLYDKSVRRCFT